MLTLKLWIVAGHRKLVRAKVDGWLMDNLALFTPTVMNSELKIADAAVQADAKGCSKLIVENRGYCHMELEEGMRLGALEKAVCSLPPLANVNWSAFPECFLPTM